MTNQEAIDLLDNLIGMIEDNHGSNYDSAIRMAIDALESKWIPCNERLPDETGLYIVTDKKERVAFRWYSIKFNFAELTDTEEVIAWMYLPEPYRKE